MTTETDVLYMVASRGVRRVTIRAFDPAEHPTQAQSPYNHVTKRSAWDAANRAAVAHKQAQDPIVRKARDIVFVGIDGVVRMVKQAEVVSRGDVPKHHYTVTLKVRKGGVEHTTQEQASNKREATDAARAKLDAATTLVSCVKGERVDAPAVVAPVVQQKTTTNPGGVSLPWE